MEIKRKISSLRMRNREQSLKNLLIKMHLKYLLLEINQRVA